MKYLYFIPFVFIMGCSSSSQVSAIKRNLYSYRNGIYRVEYTGGRGPISWPALHPLGWVKDKAEAGGQGRKGRTGPHLWGRVSGIPSGDSMLLSVHIVSNDGQAEVHYVVNPRLGRLGIFSSGGTGAGGKGGGSGASWLWGGRNGGTGGEGGEGGDGGVIEVRYDSSALAYVNCGCIDYYNPGGSGGDGGSGGSGGNNGNGTMAGNDGIEGLAGAWGPPIVVRGPDGTVLRTIPVFVLHYGQNDDEAERWEKRIREYYRQSN